MKNDQHLMEETLRRIEDKVDENTHTTSRVLEQTLRTNGRVDGHEWRIKEIEKWKDTPKTSSKQSGSLNNKVLMALITAVLVALFIIAGILQVDLPSGLTG